MDNRVHLNAYVEFQKRLVLDRLHDISSVFGVPLTPEDFSNPDLCMVLAYQVGIEDQRKKTSAILRELDKP